MLNQKYTPTKFSDLVFQNEVLRKRLETYAQGKRKDNILIYGPYGTAKSTTARIIAESSRNSEDTLFDVDVDIINCVRFNVHQAKPINVDLIERGWSLSGQKYPYAVLDEFDILNPADQNSVRDVMDRNSGRGGFILTTNHLHRVDGAIQSRCDVVELLCLEPAAMLAASQKILAAEGVSISDEVVLNLISTSQGNWRSLLRKLEDVVHGIQEKMQPK